MVRGFGGARRRVGPGEWVVAAGDALGPVAPVGGGRGDRVERVREGVGRPGPFLLFGRVREQVHHALIGLIVIRITILIPRSK